MRFVIGLDEVGRGSLAGPVVVAAVLMPASLRIPPSLRLRRAGRNRGLLKLRDSKKLTALGRERWFEFFKKPPNLKYTLAKVYPRNIEKINISRAANLAALRAFERLTKTYNLKPETCHVYLDGGLYLGNGKNRISAKTVIRGDEKIQTIKIASIIAKVYRDKLMARLAEKYPRYGLEIHKGYGTRSHYAAIKKFGLSEIHRATFIHD